MAEGDINTVVRDPKSPRDFSLEREELKRQFRLAEKEIRFRESDIALESGVLEYEVRVHVVDGNGTPNVYSDRPSVTVVDLGGTASDRVISDQPAVFSRCVAEEDGKRVTVWEARVTLGFGGPGTFILGLDDSAGTGLIVTDTLTVTAS